MANPFIIGRGTVVTVAPLESGVRAEIPEQTITVGATAVAIAATTITVEALDEPLVASVANPVFLAFEDAIDGSDRFVVVTAPAIAGATTLTIAPLKRAIAAASTAIFPVKLQARTNADIATTSGDATSTTFDGGGFADGVVTSAGYTVSCGGNLLQLDAGYRTCLHAYQNFREVQIRIQLPNPGAGYTTGYVYTGVASITDIPVTNPADGIISNPISFAIRGAMRVIEPA